VQRFFESHRRELDAERFSGSHHREAMESFSGGHRRDNAITEQARTGCLIPHRASAAGFRVPAVSLCEPSRLCGGLPDPARSPALRAALPLN
jgi:hypothetical protein